MGMRGLVPHILFLFHSVPFLPRKPGDREQTKLAGEEGGSQGTDKERRPDCGLSRPPCLLWGWSLFIPPTEGSERGLALPYP